LNRKTRQFPFSAVISINNAVTYSIVDITALERYCGKQIVLNTHAFNSKIF